MALRNATPQYFIPTGLSDSIDQTNAFPGACRSLQNLVFDRSDPQAITGRPGLVDQITNAQLLAYLKGLDAATTGANNICLLYEWGGFLFGMVSCVGGAYNGKDVPFVYNLNSSSLNGWSVNPAAADCPATINGLPVAGELPSCAVNGPTAAITHPNFPATKFGFITAYAGAATATFSVVTTATNALTARPTCVATYLDRYWFGVGITVQFTDTLVSPPNIAAASQALTANEGDTVIALHSLSIKQTQQGILQGLLSFGNSGTVYQITGNYGGSPTLTSNTLLKQQVSDAAALISANTITSTSNGVAFMASDGVRLIQQNGVLSFLNGGVDSTGQPVLDDIVQPFQNCTNRATAVASYENGVYRVCVATIWRGQATTGEFWYDFTRKRWNGPHFYFNSTSTGYAFAAGWGGKTYVASNASGFIGRVMVSQIIPDANSVYTDVGTSYSFNLSTANFPLSQSMNEQFLVEATAELGQTTAVQVIYGITAYDELDTPLDTITLNTRGQGPLWNGSTWNGTTWAAALRNARPYRLTWTKPLVFNKIYFSFQGTVVSGIGIKNQFYRIQNTGYLMQYPT